ncbi:asparagine synthase (glutamine-hydrolyzing) [Hymenobacter seoulensis]
MCGIAGFFNINSDLGEVDLRKMTNCISHRGPNADGYFLDQSVGLGHRRLSILDLSAAANQPMFSHDGRYVIIFNGEVYNFKEIASSLNVEMNTTSDTEVILEAYIQLGVDFVHLLNGMFAIAIYDKENDSLEIFRDRLGVKPVYYFYDGIKFIFGSELKTILSIKSIRNDLTVDHEAVKLFLHLGYIPRPYSIYKEIRKMDSGSYIKISKKEFFQLPYWEIEKKISASVLSDYDEAKEELKKLLISSVGYRMIADVPFGTFLSGGIDSSLVTAIAQSLSSKPVKSFSIGFESTKHDESQFAKAVAHELGTNHHDFLVTHKEAIEVISSIGTIYDEPFADSSCVPTLMVSKLARQHVTMTLSGDGGDELFQGYGMYTWADRMNASGFNLIRKPAAFVLDKMGSRYKRVAQLIDYPSMEHIRSHIFSQEQYMFSSLELDTLLRSDWNASAYLQEKWPWPSGRLPTAAEEQALFDMQYYLQDDLLVKVDRATMRHSLEARVPLLDYRIVEFALNVSPQLKVKGGVTKYLLKEILYDYLPKRMFQRPKWGFSIPLGDWLSNELHYLIDEYLSEDTIIKVGVVSFHEVKKLVKRFDNGEKHLYNRIWLLIVLHQWFVFNKI